MFFPYYGTKANVSKTFSPKTKKLRQLLLPLICILTAWIRGADGCNEAAVIQIGLWCRNDSWM